MSDEISRLVYVVEDDEAQANYLTLVLQRSGFSVVVFPDGGKVLYALRRRLPSAILLDRRLPDVDGLEIVHWIRSNCERLPIVMLTNSTLEHDVVKAFEAGADHYIAKPAQESELIARISSVIRRYESITKYESNIRIGEYNINFSEKTVILKNEQITLSPKEYEIAELLFKNIGNVVTRESVLVRVWGRCTESPGSRTLDTHIYKIRRKLKLGPESGVLLKVIYTHGYRLDVI